MQLMGIRKVIAMEERQKVCVRCPECGNAMWVKVYADEVQEHTLNEEWKGITMCDSCHARVRWNGSMVIKEGMIWMKYHPETTIERIE